jgi:ABC-type thiamine transport system substrate-binding protein
MSVSYNTSEFYPSVNTTIHHAATVNQGFYSNGQLASVTRTAVHDSANLKKIDELIKFAYNANGQLQSQTTSYVPPPNSTVRQPGPTSTRDPKFDTTPDGRIADDNQFTYKGGKLGDTRKRRDKPDWSWE